jgi:homoserine O-acetyltransferase
MGFDAATLEVTSPPVAMVKGVQHMFGNGAASYSVADNGTLLYIPGEGSQVAIQLQRFMPDGEVRNLSEVAAILHPRISPDGRYVAYSKDLGSQGDIWVYDQERDVATRLTLEPNVGDYTPIWGPNGEWITYSSGSDGANLDIYRKRADGSGEAELVLGDDAGLRAYSWSSDGSTLLFSKRTEDRGFDLHLQRFDPSGKPAGESVALVASRDIDLHGAFSPDDRFVAYSSRESGVEHVYLSQVDRAGRWQVSDADGGQAPRWSGDGRRIYYHQGAGANSEVRFVEIFIEQGSPRLGRPQVALSTPLASVQATSASFDVHPVDGSLAVTVALWELESSGHPVLRARPPRQTEGDGRYQDCLHEGFPRVPYRPASSNWRSSSVNQYSERQANGRFPEISITDMVNSQHGLLTDVLEIPSLHGVVGLSMGGMQAFEWAVRYPGYSGKTSAAIGSPRLPTFDIALWTTSNKLMALYRECECKEALEATVGFRMTSLVPTKLGQEIGRTDAVATLHGRGAARFESMGIGQAWDQERQAEAMISHDIARDFDNDMQQAAKRVKSDFLIIISADKRVVTPQPSRDFAALIDAQLVELDEDWPRRSMVCGR